MKRITLLIVCLLWAAGSLSAQEATVVYTEGNVFVQDHKGARWDPEIGSELVYNDTLLTGYNGFTEIQTEGSTVSIHSNSVFKLMEAEKGGQKQSVFSCMLGSVYLKVQKITGTGPRITSGSMAAGVRGTEFEVYSGVDGSTLIRVVKGQVEVESQGKLVSLNPDEAVEVKLGRPPGQKYTVKQPIDFSKWNQGKYEEFLKDPLGSMKSVEVRMLDYIKEIKNLYAEYQRILKILETEEAKRKKLEEEEGEEASKKYYREQIMPIRNEATLVYLNIRFNSLSALSLRRFVAGRMYLFMKTKYINDTSAKIYQDFLAMHNRVLTYFYTDTLKFIVEPDI
jgi:hypothetical protein